MRRKVEFIAHEVGVKVSATLIGPAVPTLHTPEGWQQTQRMNRMSFPEWQGAPGWELQIPMMFDGLRNQRSVLGEVHLFESLGTLWPKRIKENRPPILIVDSNGDIPHDFTESPRKRWVISTMEFQDYISNRHYKRVRQICSVNVIEWMTEGVVKVTTPSHKNVMPKTYRIKKGDTLQKIATRFYGSSGYWKEIALFNKIRDPHNVRVGRVIKLPKVVWGNAR